jgi:hypothetical protein
MMLYAINQPSTASAARRYKRRGDVTGDEKGKEVKFTPILFSILNMIFHKKRPSFERL